MQSFTQMTASSGSCFPQLLYIQLISPHLLYSICLSAQPPNARNVRVAGDVITDLLALLKQDDVWWVRVEKESSSLFCSPDGEDTLSVTKNWAGWGKRFTDTCKRQMLLLLFRMIIWEVCFSFLF